jgi:hypothetical protein
MRLFRSVSVVAESCLGSHHLRSEIQSGDAQPKSDSNILQTVGWSSQAMPMAVERPRYSDYQSAITFKSAWIQGRHVRRPQLKSALCLIADVWHRAADFRLVP